MPLIEDGEESSDEDQERGLRQDELDELPIYEYKPSADQHKDQSEDKECTICMSEYM